MKPLVRALEMLRGDAGADRVVPRSGLTAQLTLFTAAAMAFLAVFAMALALATARLADRWEGALAQSATIRISAPASQMERQVAAVLKVLGETPGVTAPRALSDAEQRQLLAPFFGPDLPVETLPLPQLVEFTEVPPGFDTEGLRFRLRAEAPGAVLDDHTRWRRPLVAAAQRLNLVALVAVVLIGATVAAMITMAAGASLAANAQVIGVMRLVGARDAFIARAFVRRFTLRAFAGAGLGTGLALLAVQALPEAQAAGGFLTGLGFSGWGWIAPFTVPPFAAIIAFWATRHAAFRALKEVP